MAFAIGSSAESNSRDARSTGTSFSQGQQFAGPPRKIQQIALWGRNHLWNGDVLDSCCLWLRAKDKVNKQANIVNFVKPTKAPCFPF